MAKLLTWTMGLIFISASISAHAGPVLWTIEDLFYSDGFEFRPPASDPAGEPILFVNNPVAVTGSFVYDADTDVVSEVHVTTPDGERATGCTAVACTPESVTISDFTGFDYDEGNYNQIATRLGLFDLANFTQILVLNFASDPTNLGGEIAIQQAFEFVCAAACPAFDVASMPFRTEIKGTGARVVGVAIVPEPSTLGLFGAGILGLGLARRKRAI